MGRRPKRKKKSATPQEWERLIEEKQLRSAFLQLAQATQRGPNMGEALTILNHNPGLVRYLNTIRERQDATESALARPDYLLREAPAGSGTPSLQNWPGMGGWAGDKKRPVGVMNAPILRDWADRSVWVRIAISKLRRWVERSDIAVLPADETKRYNKSLAKKLQQLLDMPNEYRDSYRSLIGPVVEDILVLDRGVLEKNMNLKRQAQALYYQDGATIKIYPQWSGNPAEPRYLYDPGGQKPVPLRNDECICIIQNISTWRFSYSPVQFLADTIQADIEATLSASHMVKMKPPPHVVQIPQATGVQLDAMRTRYDSEFAGRKEVMFLGGPQTAHVFPLVFSARDQQFLEWQIYMARKIATIFGIAPQELGITNDVNRATAQVMADGSEYSGYIPLLLLLEEFLNRELLADFAAQNAMDRADLQSLNLRIVYPEVSEAARQLHAEKAVDIAVKSLQGLPSATLNQMLAMRGEKPVPGGDTFYIKTATGAMPWLSYDGNLGDYGPLSTGGELGAQDAAGGPDGSEDAPEAPDDKDAQPPAQAAPAPTGSAPAASASDSAPTGKSYQDRRRPGHAWSSHYL